jgi:hypothetical protein
MSKLPAIFSSLTFPVIASPLFIISNPKLVIAQCKAGVVGSMPALNARPAAQLDEWLAEITEALAAHDRANPDSPAAPFAINQIVHRSNDRLEEDMQAIGFLPQLANPFPHRYVLNVQLLIPGTPRDGNSAIAAFAAATVSRRIAISAGA